MPLKIAIAFDSFKNGASSIEINDAIQEKLKDYELEVQYFNLSDGGENTIHSICQSFQNVIGFDALQRKIQYQIGFYNDIPVIEMAQTVGIEKLIKTELNPKTTTSYGFGESLSHYLTKNQVYLTVGGSATVDFGFGFLKGIGTQFIGFEDKQIEFESVLDIIRIKSIILPKIQTKFIVLTDVQNLLTGNLGAVRVFGPQKGLQPIDIDLFDQISNHVINLIGKSQLPGDGAAGGIVYILRNLLGAEIISGAEFVLQSQNFRQKTENFEVLITGEGRLDSQTKQGKACYVVCNMFKGKRIGVFGEIKTQVDFLDSVFCCQKGVVDISQALAETAENVSECVLNIIKLLL